MTLQNSCTGVNNMHDLASMGVPR